MNLRKIKMAWLANHDLPQLYPEDTLRIPPAEQFLRHMLSALNSWSMADLTKFHKACGHRRPPKGMVESSDLAQCTIIEALGAWEVGENLYFVDTDRVREFINA
jgi:hypothetical protein